MNYATALLQTTKSYLITSVTPNAAAIDSDPNALRQAIDGLGELGLLGLRIPPEWGVQINQETFENFQELVARYSGALAFLQTQHQSAAGMLSQSDNSSLKQEYLPLMSKGKLLVGVGFSHLRRGGDRPVKAFPVEGGYQLEGQVPWVTGWEIFQEFIVAATLPDGEAVFGVVPFVETCQEKGGAIAFDEPMQLAAIASTNTVTATLKQWFLPQKRVVFIKPPDWIHENDRKNVLNATFLSIGCALAGLDILEAAWKTKSLPFIKEAFESLNSEVASCRTAIREAQENPDLQLAEKQKLRAWVIDLAVRCAHAAVTVSSGAANQSYHPAQRVYREALVFTVSGQTPGMMEATLQRLISSPVARTLSLTVLYGRGGFSQGSGKLIHILVQNPPLQSDNVNTTDVTGHDITRSQPHNNSIKTISYSRVIHLSHVIDSNIPQWPGDPNVEFETVAELGKDGYYLRRFSLGEHSATHINAPKSFHSAGIGIDRYPASSLVVPAVLININDKAAINSDYALTIDDILTWEQQHGQILADSVVLVYTGWQDKWSEENEFLNPDFQGQMHFPGIGRDATLFLLQFRQIAGLGIDTHGVDSGQDETFATNSLVLEQPRIVLENLANLDQLPSCGTTLVIGILRLKDGSGSPVGAIALVP